jgi:hypothetical protein
MASDVRTSVLVGFTDEYAVRVFFARNQSLGQASPAGLRAAEMIDRRIEIGPSDMRTDFIKNGEFAFERSNHGRHAGIARRGRREVFHNQIPIRREPFPAGPHLSCMAPETRLISR